MSDERRICPDCGMDVTHRVVNESIDGYGVYIHHPLDCEQITALRKRLAIEGDHPFPEGYDAIDLLNDRLDWREGQIAALREQVAELEAEIDARDKAWDAKEAEFADRHRNDMY